MADAPCGCHQYVDRLLEEQHRLLSEKDRWVQTRFEELQRGLDKTERELRDRLQGLDVIKATLDNWRGRLAIMALGYGLLMVVVAWLLRGVSHP
jgi:hypothetical protein